MSSLYTLGEWTVMPGREEEFVTAWRQFAEWTTTNVRGNTWAKLLQDSDAPQRFVSFGPWESDDAVAEWRQNPAFEEHVAKIRELVEGFTPHNMSVATEAGPETPDP